MTTFGNVVVFACIISASVSADSAISLCGTVKDGDDKPIAGAAVSLVSDSSLLDTTDADGGFSISKNSAAANSSPLHIPVRSISDIRIHGNTLTFITVLPAATVFFRIYSANGRRTAAQTLEKTVRGTCKFTLPDLVSGIYIVQISLGRSAHSFKLVSNDGTLSYGGIQQKETNGKPVLYGAAVTVDTLFIEKTGFKPLGETITSYMQTGMEIIMDRTKSPSITVSSMPQIKEMPDPLTMKNGDTVTTPEQWRLRRREMIRILEDYEYGHMPPPPGNVKATVATALTRVTAGGKQADYRMMHLTFGPGEKCGFDLGLFTPVTPPDSNGHPVLIYLGYANPTKSSLGDASVALGRGYAVAIINYTQLGADNTSWKSSAFFPSYPDYDWRDFSAWAWGLSRAVDYLVTDTVIDKGKIMVTGVSRCGQPVLLAGAFDERIALSAPVAGGMALRFSGKEMGGGLGQGITEVVDQGTYWFGPLFEKFRNQTPRLPCDQHWLPALTAPRLFIMCNSFADQYGRAYAAVQTYLGAKPVYEFLDADDNLGMNFREGTHGMTSADWSALLDFADQKLLKKEGTRKFDVIPPADKLP